MQRPQVAANPTETNRSLTKGVLLETTMRPGISAVARIAVHGGFDCKSTSDQSLHVKVKSAVVVWCAFYSPSIEANHWEPFNQPDAAAYMPLPFSKFSRTVLGGTGTFLMQELPTREPIQGILVDDGKHRAYRFFAQDRANELLTYMEAFFISAGVQAEHVPKCLEGFLKHSPMLNPGLTHPNTSQE